MTDAKKKSSSARAPFGTPRPRDDSYAGSAPDNSAGNRHSRGNRDNYGAEYGASTEAEDYGIRRPKKRSP